MDVERAFLSLKFGSHLSLYYETLKPNLSRHYFRIMLVPEDYIAPKILRFSDVQMYVHQKCSPEGVFFSSVWTFFSFLSLFIL